MADPMYKSGGFVFFLFLAGVLTLAGVGCAVGGAGKLHKDCNDGSFEVNNPPQKCEDLFRPVWWAIVFEFGVVVTTYAVVLSGLLGRARLVLVAFIAMAAIDVMDELEGVLKLKDTDFFKTIESREEEIDVTMAGLIVLSMVNFILVAIVGITAGDGSPIPAPSSRPPPPPKKQAPASGAAQQSPPAMV